MIKAWDKDGKDIEVKDMTTDSEIEEGFEQYLTIFSLISQKYKTIITKLEMDGKNFKMTVEQK